MPSAGASPGVLVSMPPGSVLDTQGTGWMEKAGTLLGRSQGTDRAREGAGKGCQHCRSVDHSALLGVPLSHETRELGTYWKEITFLS